MRVVSVILLLTCTLFGQYAFSQKATLKGKLIDSAENKQVVNAVIAILNQKDSALVTFKRSDASGAFALSLDTGNYKVLITHPWYADVVEDFRLSESGYNMEAVKMLSKAKLLSEVIVKSGAPIKIKGDTTVYTADSFKVEEGANVEQLLKKLPGVQVDRNGKITAMGEKVTKVLVDGEEFFGDDPGIATKNLRADAIKEVEIFDKKSDQAVFTGVDDGVKDKTINLKLKEDAKKGYFGQVQLASNGSELWDNNIMANVFKGKKKLAGYGIMSNTGKTDLSWEEREKYSDMSGNMEVMDGGGISIMINDYEYFGNNQNGIPKNWNTGFHFSNKYNEDKASLNMGYKNSKRNVISENRTLTTHFIGDSSYYSNSDRNGYRTNFQHGVNARYEYKLDSMNTITVKGNGNFTNGTQYSTLESQSYVTSNYFLNRNSTKSQKKSNNNTYDGSVLWLHKFKKLKRTLSINTSYKENLANADVNRYANTSFYNAGIFNRTDTIDQFNTQQNIGKFLNTSVVYTEPLGKDWTLSLSHKYQSAKNDLDNQTFAATGGGKYQLKVDSLTNHYTFSNIGQLPGFSFKYAKKKMNISIGSDIGFYNYEQNNLTKGINRDYRFTNFFPSANFSNSFKKNTYVGFRYSGRTTAPTLNQLQPITDNSNPLYQIVGNPDLEQSFTHNANMYFNRYNVLKQTGFWMNIWGSTTTNAIVSNNFVDINGKTISSSLNANGNYSLGLYSSVDFGPLGEKGPKLSAGFNFNIMRYIMFLNGKKGQTDNNTYSLEYSLNKDVEKKINAWFNQSISYTKAANSLSTKATANYFSTSVEAGANVHLFKKWRLSSNIDFSIRQKDPNFPVTNEFTIWNATLKRKFMKDNMEVYFTVNDILDQNRGYNRSFSQNLYSENYYNALRRYGMLGIKYNFKNKSAKQNQPEEDEETVF